MILGITGGTGCGKTTLLDIIWEHGGLVLDCDQIYHELLLSDKKLIHSIDRAFPGVVEDSVLQRKKLGNIVFNDEKALLKLNKITHKAVKAEVLRRLETAPDLAAIDAIALFEADLAPLCDLTVAVVADEKVRLNRLTVRDGISRTYARNRIHAQHDESWFREKCDYVLENNGSRDLFREKCLAFLTGHDII